LKTGSKEMNEIGREDVSELKILGKIEKAMGKK
jgi:hypothetical protein